MGRELVLFMNSLWYGAVLMMLYDGLRILRRVFSHSALLVGVEDLIFWIGSSFFLFTVFFRENSGILRIYLFVGAGVGVLAWHFSLSRFFVEVLVKILRKIKEIFGIPVRKAVILVKRLKFWISRCRISLYAKYCKDRGAEYGQKKKIRKRAEHKKKTAKRAE